MARIAANGPTPEELEDAKRYLTGSYALRFSSSAKIADILLSLQIEGLGIDYIDKRNQHDRSGDAGRHKARIEID